MKNENIPGDLKSKSIKDTKEEIQRILVKLENKDVNLDSNIKEYERLLKLNKHMNELFKKKLRIYPKEKNKIVIKKLLKNAKKVDIFIDKFLRRQSKSLLIKPMKYGVLSGGKKIRSSIIYDVGKLYNLKSSQLTNVCAAVESIPPIH